MRKGIKGSFTVEAAVIVPLILVVFAVALSMLFYYHDKNVLTSAAYETAVYGAAQQEKSETELENHFYSRVHGKLLLFSSIQGEATIEEKQIQIACRARKNRMSIKTESVIQRTDPEDYIRKIRKIEKIQNGLGGTE